MSPKGRKQIIIFNKMYSPKIEKAICVAAYLHRYQTRKGNNIPYIIHPFMVFLILHEYTDNEDILIAGLLHDVLEDSDPKEYDENKLRSDFGERVFKLIKDVSEQKNGDLGEDDAKSSLKDRKEAYLNHLQSVDEESIWVSVADKIHNLRSTIEDLKTHGHIAWDKFNASKDSQMWFYETFYHTVKEKTANPIINEFAVLLEEIKTLKL